MGIKNLSKYLKDNFPELFEVIHISEYAYKRVAIDTSLYLCHYKALCGDAWLGAFIKLVSVLRENEVHCVFIYDTKSPPEKDAEKKERMEAREKMEERVFILEQALEKYETTGEVEKVLIDFQEKKKISQKSLLNQRSFLNIGAIQYAIKNMRKQLFTITPQDFETTRELFKILQVPYFLAPMEAETMCSDLCIQGKVDAVLSEDTDVLAYGAPVFLTKVNTSEASCVRIRHVELLEKFKMTADEFLDFCIMCGTDYNKNIFRVGPHKAFQFISDYKSIDALPKKTKLDITILNHERVRELFRAYEKSGVKVPYCGSPDFSSLEQFVFKKNVRTNIDSLRKSFIHNTIVIEDKEENKDDEEEEVIIEID